jgi:hypothetical protein
MRNWKKELRYGDEGQRKNIIILTAREERKTVP